MGGQGGRQAGRQGARLAAAGGRVSQECARQLQLNAATLHSPQRGNAGCPLSPGARGMTAEQEAGGGPGPGQ
jgi:hypothetical protein